MIVLGHLHSANVIQIRLDGSISTLFDRFRTILSVETKGQGIVSENFTPGQGSIFRNLTPGQGSFLDFAAAPPHMFVGQVPPPPPGLSYTIKLKLNV